MVLHAELPSAVVQLFSPYPCLRMAAGSASQRKLGCKAACGASSSCREELSRALKKCHRVIDS